MKYNFQIKIIKIYNSFLRILLLNKPFKKINLPTGFLEWDEEKNKFFKIKLTSKINLESLLFIENQKKYLMNNTRHFLEGGDANNALLWGSRGTGKSSLVLATFCLFHKNYNFSTIEIKFFQIKYLPKILRLLENEKKKIIIYCDDFSFDSNNESFILFKNTLEGSLRKHTNIIFYVTSNYRHLVKNIENNSFQETHNKDANNDLISLSDRFGIWLGFHNFNQENFLKIVLFQAKLHNLKFNEKVLTANALEWSLLRGSFSGREAVNFIRFLSSKVD
ncbi:ATP-binding protein [Alphaproteobacteria bacterium]|nr:ATP-binding protein [Alphaproteobacteria bacterium]